MKQLKIYTHSPDFALSNKYLESDKKMSRI